MAAMTTDSKAEAKAAKKALKEEKRALKEAKKDTKEKKRKQDEAEAGNCNLQISSKTLQNFPLCSLISYSTQRRRQAKKGKEG